MRAAGYRKVGFKRNPVNLLKRAGQPQERPNRSYRYCVKGKKNKKSELAAVFTDSAHPRVGLIASDARTHRVGNVHPGSRASRIPAGAKRLGRGVYVKRAGVKSRRFVFGTKGGKVKFVGVASREVAKRKRTLKPFLRLGGFR